MSEQDKFEIIDGEHVAYEVPTLPVLPRFLQEITEALRNWDSLLTEEDHMSLMEHSYVEGVVYSHLMAGNFPFMVKMEPDSFEVSMNIEWESIGRYSLRQAALELSVCDPPVSMPFAWYNDFNTQIDEDSIFLYSTFHDVTIEDIIEGAGY